MGTILLYHRVASSNVDPFRLCVPPDRFRDQLRFLRSSCAVTTLDALVDQLGDTPSESYSPVVVTFDDGYADNIEAYEIAAELDVPLTLFVSTGAIAAGKRFWWDELTAIVYDDEGPLTIEIDGRTRSFPRSTDDERAKTCLKLHGLLRPLGEDARQAVLTEQVPRWSSSTSALGRPLTAAELRELARRPGAAIGAHGVSHRALSSLHTEEQLAEVRESKQFLEELLHQPVDFFSFPFGRPRDVGAPAMQAVAAAGYRAACTTVQAAVYAADDRFALPRLTVYDWPADALRDRLGAL